MSRMWSILMSVPCELEKDVYCTCFDGIFYIYHLIQLTDTVVQVIYILLLSFCLFNLSITN